MNISPARRVPGARSAPPRRALIAAGAAAVATVAMSVAVAQARPSAALDPGARGHRGQVRDVSANLWEWNWPSVANECTTVLGPKGYASVQVAPPADSLSRTKLGDGSDTVLHPWWEVYQPVDYTLTSRMGTESQFRAMVTTCRKAGVKVIVDAVINHMTGQGSVSYGGVNYTKYSYQGLYGPQNFHSYPADCPVPPDKGTGSREGNIADFNDPKQVFNCELVGLSDLRTETTYVRDRLAGYLNKLLGYGVSGFRVDAAKHIGQTDLAAIYSRLNRTVDRQKPFFALENFPGSPGELSPFAFTGVGTLLGFDAAYQLKNAFKSYTDAKVGNITSLRVWGEAAGLLPSDKTLVFVENHDTERGNDTLSYKDGATNVLANQFLLAAGYGTPQVYAAFTFPADNAAQSPPSDARGFITDTNCSSAAWACVDRQRAVANMVGWHNYVGRAPRTNWYDDDTNLIAFSRGNRGWIAINNATTAVTHTFQTGLPRGTYCDVIHGDYSFRSCSGPTVTVDAHGRATITVAAKDSVAFTKGNRVRS